MQGLLFLILFLLSSCGGREKNEEYSLGQKAKYHLSNKNYKKAIKNYKKLVKENPKNRKYEKLLADSYVGYAGFELVPFLSKLDNLLNRRVVDEHVIRNVLNYLDGYTKLTADQSRSIENAMKIYINFTVVEDEDVLENYFKIGVVSVYSLVNEINVLSKKLEPYLRYDSHDNRETLDLKKDKILKIGNKHFENIIVYFLTAYVCLRNSFDQIQHILDKVDFAFSEMLNVQFKRILKEIKGMNLKKFLALLLKYNPELHARVLREIDENCNPESILNFLEDMKKRLIQTPEEDVLMLELVEHSIQYVTENPDISCETEP